MTQPNVPTAQRPWQAQPGGYDVAIAQANAQYGGVPQQANLPSALQQQMQQAQPQQQFPPQMQQQGALQQLNGDPSPLSYTQPNMPQPMQIRPPQMQQQPQFQQPVQQQQYQTYPQQQQFPPNPQFQQPQAPQQPQVLQGPGVPTELQGRSVQDLIGIYNGLRQTHLQLMSQSQQQQQASALQPQRQEQQQAPVEGQRAFDWRNPAQSMAQVVDERVGAMIDQKIVPMLAPMAAQNAMAGIQNARQQAANAIGVQRFTAMEPQIMQALQGADPIHLQNPRTWALAAQAVAGQIALSGVQSPIIQNQNGPGAYPSQQVQPGQNPMPNLNSFFSEQPNQGGPMGGGFQLSAAQTAAAHAMGIPLGDYAAWAAGVRPY